MTTPDTRPNPVTDALGRVAPVLSALVGVVSALGSAGVFSQAQVTATQAYAAEIATVADPSGPLAVAVGAVIGLVTAGATYLGTMRAGKGATVHTTPLVAPQDFDGTPLVRADGLPLGGDRRSPADTPTTQTDMRGV